MAKLDRLGWAAGVAFTSYGVRVGIRMTDSAILDRVVAHLPPAWKPAKSPVVSTLYSLVCGGSTGNSSVRRFHVLYTGAGRVARTMEVDEVLETLESALHYQIAFAAQRRLFVHAGAVGWRGRAIVIPGPSGSGKSSLVAALVRAGATYFSDEYAVFDTHGSVHPYAKPLSLRATNGAPRRKLTAEALGGLAARGPLPVGLVAVTEYRSGVTWRPRQMSPAEGLLALLGNTVLARVRPAAALDTLKQVVRDATIVTGKRGEAGSMVESLLDRAPASHRVGTRQSRVAGRARTAPQGYSDLTAAQGS